MKISKYVGDLLRDFFMNYGFLVVVSLIVGGIHSKDMFEISLLCQVMLGASAFTLFKFAFTSKYDLSKKAQTINFCICSVIGNLLVVLWLWIFSTDNLSLLAMYIVVIIVVKAFVFTMMYINGNAEAKLVNDRLNQYKKISK